MPRAMKEFAELKGVYAELKAQALQRQREQALRLQRERQARHEADLFKNSIGQVIPLRAQNRVEPFFAPPLPVALQHLADEAAALQESLSDEFDVESLLDTDQALSYSANGVGPEVVRKLRRGHWVIQDELDLHGMRRDTARTSLGLFLRHATKTGIRCVRVIHGKGLGSINKEPVLKGMVYRWLVQKEEVMAFCVARASDGGAGALVVLLRGTGSRPS